MKPPHELINWIDSSYLPRRENQVADATSLLNKDKITKFPLQAYLLLASYCSYYPPLELILQIFKFLAASLEDLPEPLRLRG